MPLTVLAWSVRNEHKTGYFHFSSIKMIGILDLNAGGVLALQYGEKKGYDIECKILQQSDRIKSYPEKCEYILTQSSEIIKAKPLLYSICHIKGMLNFMLATGRYDSKMFFGDHPDEYEISLISEIKKQGVVNGLKYYCSIINSQYLLLTVLSILFNLLVLLSIILFVFDKSFPALSKCFILLIIFYSVIISGPGGLTRYKVPILPYLVLTLPFMHLLIKKFLNKYIFRRTI